MGSGFEQEEHDDLVAWKQAWLRLEAGDHEAAAAWFERVDAFPSGQRHAPTARNRAQLRIAQALARLMTPPPGAGEQAAARPDAPTQPLPLDVTSLGGFVVRRGDKTLPICRVRKPIALFRYLLSRTQRTAHREELMEALWPNAHPSEALHSLHVAVSALRQYLDHGPESYLVFAVGQYSINPEAVVEDDGRRFARANEEAEGFWRGGAWEKAHAAYGAATECYRGDYYVDDQDLPWATAERERLLARYLVALERLGQLWVRRQRFDAAAECFQRLLERDNYREDMYCQLIHCYLELGRRGEAIRQYERCIAVLANDLGLEPMPETRRLYRRAIGSNNAFAED